MSLVRGKNVAVLFWNADEGVWFPYACGRSCSLNVATDFIETSVSGQGVWRTNVPMANSFTGNIDGLMNLEKVNFLSIADLRAKQYAQTRLLVRFQREDDDAHIYTDEFYCYISGSTDTNSFDNVSTFTIDLIGDGAITQIFTPSPIANGKMFREQFILPATEVTVTTSDITATTFDNIISVVLDGYDYPVIINTGTPIGDEVKAVVATGVITFPYADADNDRNGYIEYQII